MFVWMCLSRYEVVYSSPRRALTRRILLASHVLSFQVSPEVRDEVEADSYWCLTKLLDGIQDNYTAAQVCGFSFSVYMGR